MQISIINDEHVNTDKAGYLGLVSETIEILDLKHFAKLALKHHICCGIFNENVRRLSNLNHIDFLQYDFDNGTTVESIKELFKDYNIVILASKNHMKEKNDGRGKIPRFHIFLPFKTPITDPAFYSFVVKHIAEKFRIEIDKKAVDSTRYFYKHSKFLYGKMNGEFIDPKEYKSAFMLKTIKQKEEDAKREEYLFNIEKTCTITEEERIKAVKHIISDKVGASISGAGGNNNTFIAACYCVRFGLKDARIKEVMDWYNNLYCNPKWNKNGLDNKIKYAKKIVKLCDYFSPPYILKILGK